MEHRRVGASGLYFSQFSYGGWLTHGKSLREAGALACIAEAIELGITTFDTADVYADGEAERILGVALRSVNRSAVEIVTKAFWPSGTGYNERGLSRKHLTEACNASLNRLGTDYVDVFLAHRYDYSTPLEETLIAAADLVRQGKVLYFGVSEWRAEEIERALPIAQELRLPFIVNQAQYHLFWRVIEREVLPTCSRNGVGIMAFSPLAQGTLTGKYRVDALPLAGSRATDALGGSQMIAKWISRDKLVTIGQMGYLAEAAGLPLAHVALAWTLRSPTVSTAILGASSTGQLTTTLRDFDLVKVTDSIMDAVAAAGDVLAERDPGRTMSQRTRP